MHQLSLDHELAAPTSPATTDTWSLSHEDRHNDADHNQSPILTSVAAAADAGDIPVTSHASMAADGLGGGHEEGCPDCGDHTMAFGACLLALTLLVLSWSLAPPRVRLLPPRLLAWASAVIPGMGRRVPALSLAELSILRT